MHINHEKNGHLLEICIFSFRNHIIIITTIFINIEKHKITFKRFVTFFDQLNSELNSMYNEEIHYYNKVTYFFLRHFISCNHPPKIYPKTHLINTKSDRPYNLPKKK